MVVKIELMKARKARLTIGETSNEIRLQRERLENAEKDFELIEVKIPIAKARLEAAGLKVAELQKLYFASTEEFYKYS